MGKAWLLILVGITVALVACLVFGFNPAAAIQEVINNPAVIVNWLQAFIDKVQQYVGYVLSILGAGVSFLLYYGQRYSQAKQQFQEVNSTMRETFTKKQTELETQLSEQKESYETRIKDLKEKAESTVELEKKCATLEATATAKQQTIDELHHFIGALPEEYKRRLADSKKIP